MSNTNTSIDECRARFGQLLRLLRKRQNLSQGDLKAASGVSDSLVSAFEHGERAVGSEVAARLADALRLAGDEREDFLLAAASTRRRDRLVAYARHLPPEILNYLPRLMAEAGVDLATVNSGSIRQVSETGCPGLQGGLEREFQRALDAERGLGRLPVVQFLSGGRKYVGALLLVQAA